MRVDGLSGDYVTGEEISMRTVRDVLEERSRKFIILFLRDNNWTSMYKIENVGCFKMDILERTIVYERVFTFKNMYHIELIV